MTEATSSSRTCCGATHQPDQTRMPIRIKHLYIKLIGQIPAFDSEGGEGDAASEVVTVDVVAELIERMLAADLVRDL